MFEDRLTIPLIISAAAVDSINPCVFGVLIFLLGFLVSVFKKPLRMLAGGLVYVVAVYVTYFVLGFGILTFAVGTGFTRGIYFGAAIIAILAGLLEIKDFFRYGRWFSLEMLPGASERIRRYAGMMGDKRGLLMSYAVAAFLGVFVPLVELPCTGAPYLAVLGLIAKGSYAKAVPFLLLYNLVFIAPLLVIIGLVYTGKSSATLEEWRKRHRRTMRLVVGLFLLSLGAYMFYIMNGV